VMNRRHSTACPQGVAKPARDEPEEAEMRPLFSDSALMVEPCRDMLQQELQKLWARHETNSQSNYANLSSLQVAPREDDSFSFSGERQQHINDFYEETSPVMTRPASLGSMLPGRAAAGTSSWPLETPREAAARRKMEAADRQAQLIKEATLVHVSEQVAARSYAHSAHLSVELSSNLPLAHGQTFPQDGRARSTGRLQHSPLGDHSPWHQGETPKQAASRRRLEAADCSLEAFKAMHAAVADDARQAFVAIREHQSKAFKSPFATQDVPRRKYPCQPAVQHNDVGILNNEAMDFETDVELPACSVFTPCYEDNPLVLSASMA